MSAENWHEERDRLTQLLKAIEAGNVTQVDQDPLRQLQATNLENVAALKARIDELNDRLGVDENSGPPRRRTLCFNPFRTFSEAGEMPASLGLLSI